jgi:sugar lactone lactonase YvrE
MSHSPPKSVLFPAVPVPLFVLALLFAAGIERSPSSVAQGAERPKVVFLQTWGRKGTKPGEFHFPIAIAVNAKDELLVTDHLNHRVQKFDTSGNLLGQFAVLPNPAAIAVDKAGNIYLTHFHASGTSTHKSGDRVSVYSPDGRLLRRWGHTGSGNGEFNCPGGIAISKNGRVYVADQTNHRVQVFDRDGKFLFKWGEYGNQPGQFGGRSSRKSRTGGPQFLAFDAAGNLWTTEGANCRIQKFTPAGKLLLHWGTRDDKPGGFGGYFTGFKNITPKSLVGPIALCFDKHGRLWVSAVSGRIQQFTPQGKYLGGFGDHQGTKPGQFYAPHGLAFDSKGRLYVVDAYNHRIQKFDVGR